MEYFKDYYVGGKYIGSKICDKDRDTFGFMGRKEEWITENITLDNKKVIKLNTLTLTELQILCGRK